jgi:hypothetical protein
LSHWKRFLLIAPGVGAGKRLIEMMMCVDETGKDDMPGGIEDLIAGGGRPVAADQLDDASTLDNEATVSAGGEQGDWILDPETHEWLPRSCAD